MNITQLDIDWQEFYYFSDIPDDQKSDFDYLDEEETGQQFIKIRDQFYDVGDFIRVMPESELGLLGWHGVAGQSYFHSYVVKLSDCGSCYIVGEVTA